MVNGVENSRLASVSYEPSTLFVCSKISNIIWLLAVDCGEPPFVKNAIANYNATYFGSKAIYNCISDKYLIEGPGYQINCLPNGRWQDQTPKCIGMQTEFIIN